VRNGSGETAQATPVQALCMGIGRLKGRGKKLSAAIGNGAALHRTGCSGRRERTMEFTGDLILEIPLWHMAVLLIILIACLGFKKCASGLIGAILFALYWVYVHNFDKFVHQSFQFNYAALFFFLIGALNALIVIALSISAFSIDD
jgi:hypothetical protein